MAGPANDSRSSARTALDERIAEAPIAAPELAPDAPTEPMEAHFARLARHPVAIPGIVENGLVRPLAGAKLPEQTRVIIVAAG